MLGFGRNTDSKLAQSDQELSLWSVWTHPWSLRTYWLCIKAGFWWSLIQWSFYTITTSDYVNISTIIDLFWKSLASHFIYLRITWSLEPPFINVKFRQTITLTPLNSAQLKEKTSKDWIVLKLRIGHFSCLKCRKFFN